MRKIFKRDLLLGTGIIVGSIILFFVASNLLLGRMDALSGDIAASRILIARRAELLSSLADIKKLSSDAEVYRKKIGELLPSQDQLLVLPQVVNELAFSHNVSANFSFSGAPSLPQTGFPGSVDFSLNANGSLSDLLLFLGDIEPGAIRFLISIEGLDFSSSGSGNYNLTLNGKAFFQ